MSSVVQMGPDKVVYISCNPQTLARDLEYFTKNGYQAEGIWPVDLFPFTSHCEVITLLEKKNRKQGRR